MADNEEEVVEEQTEENTEEMTTDEVVSEDASEEESGEGFSLKINEPERQEGSQEAVLNFEEILAPIDGENNAGSYLRYDGIYDEISEARRADEDLDQGAWQSELKIADYREVIKLAVPVIQTRSKDLQLSAWLCEALGYEHGFVGARDSVRYLHLLLNNYWEGLFPEIDEGDEEGRANALAWVDEALGDAIRKAPITTDGWGYNGHQDSKKFDIPESLDNYSHDEQVKYNRLREQAERENRATAKDWAKAVSKTNRAFCEEVNIVLQEIGGEYNELNTAVENTFDRNQAPSLPEVRKALADVKSVFEKILEQKRIEEPDENDVVEEGATDSPQGESRGGSGQGTGGAVNNREQALKRLSEIAAFFKKTEPHSPVSYLISRAVVWGNMPLENWLEDVIKDQTILNNLRQTLGFNTSSGSESDGSDDSSSGESKPDLMPLQ